MVLAGDERSEESPAGHKACTIYRTALRLEHREVVRFGDERFDVSVFQRGGERPIEIFEHLAPVHVALLDLIESSLHLRCELDVEDVGERLHHHALDLVAKLRREEAPLLQLCIPADRKSTRLNSSHGYIS